MAAIVFESVLKECAGGSLCCASEDLPGEVFYSGHTACLSVEWEVLSAEARCSAGSGIKSKYRCCVVSGYVG